MSSMSSRPMISRFVAMGLPAFDGDGRSEPGDDEVGEERGAPRAIGEVDGGFGLQDVGAQHACDPLAGADGVGVAEPAGERGCECVAHLGEDTVAGANARWASTTAGSCSSRKRSAV